MKYVFCLKRGSGMMWFIEYVGKDTRYSGFVILAGIKSSV